MKDSSKAGAVDRLRVVISDEQAQGVLLRNKTARRTALALICVTLVQRQWHQRLPYMRISDRLLTDHRGLLKSALRLERFFRFK